MQTAKGNIIKTLPIAADIKSTRSRQFHLRGRLHARMWSWYSRGKYMSILFLQVNMYSFRTTALYT